jgi:transglutaminase-like putative cysteine protease
MNRRQFLKVGAVIPAVTASRAALAQTLFAPKPGASWRTFEITTRVEMKNAGRGMSFAWLPIPSPVKTDYQRVIDSAQSGNFQVGQKWDGMIDKASYFYAQWLASESRPVVELRHRVQTRDRAVDFAVRPTNVEWLSPPDRKAFTSPTDHMPLDGIVHDTMQAAVKDARTDLDKARAIYEWVVENTFRDPKVRGCGLGDVKSLLRSGTLGGKCADINGLFVCLCRAAGLPARDVYGVRVAKSQFGYRSLGATSENITRAQHCRAEVYLSDWGWVPADPADVRKVVLEERASPLAVDDPLVQAVRSKLFGAWEMNWIAYNSGNEIGLPMSKEPRLTYLMYPHAQTATGPLDSLDPDNFRYTITAKELPAA